MHHSTFGTAVRFVGWVGIVAQLSLAGAPRAQNLFPNPSFERGTTNPAGWQLSEGAGRWGQLAHEGLRSLMVRGDGADQSSWKSEGQTLATNGLYRLSFYGRRDPTASGGCLVSGPLRVNRDFTPDENWQRYSFIFSLPSDSGSSSIRLGQWHQTGTAFFDDVELVPVVAFHKQVRADLELGEGENLTAGIYRCRMNFGAEASDYHRALVTNCASFNSDRWVFSPGAYVVYRHQIGRANQTRAALRVAINYYAGGDLDIQASQDGNTWLAVDKLSDQKRSSRLELPPQLFPTSVLFIRLAHTGGPGQCQLNTYDYEASLAQPELLPDATGQTHYLEWLQRSPALPVTLQDFRFPSAEGLAEVRLVVSNSLSQAVSIRSSLLPSTAAAAAQVTEQSLDAHQSRNLQLAVAIPQAGPQTVTLEISAHGQTNTCRVPINLGFLDDPSFGYRLPSSPDLGLWWCESGWKVGRQRALPPLAEGAGSSTLRLALARNEYEAAQIVLRPSVSSTLTGVTIDPVLNGSGQTAPIRLELNEVAYVRVDQPTDSTGWRDWFPDPLPPLAFPLPLPANLNQPLWLTVYAGPDTPPGDYRSAVLLRTAHGQERVPVQIHVYAFTLPQQTHLRSALGLSPQAINRYHRLTEPKQQAAVYEQYLENFAAHRISPYSFFAYSPMDIRFDASAGRARLNFDRFDHAAEKWLSSGRFNSFSLPLRGMGGGTFQSRHLGQLEGFQEGTPEHARLFKDYLGQIEQHLQSKGWLAQAYTYWFDEPEPKDYPFVVAGMERLKQAAPGIKRLLTEQPEPPLQGYVDIWCGLTPEWSREKVLARRAAGEQVWWYICTGPKAPYVTEFIDHPGLELRLWPWQSWQYGVTGILVWETLYWTSDLVHPPPKAQDPWEDPMSYVSGYDNPVGFVSYWGNGDGRFLYPPRSARPGSGSPCLENPINSVRWENLRDGLEDYEYFWLLRQAIDQAAAQPAQAALVAPAEHLLEIPAEISRDLTHFTRDPRLLLRHRDAVARMVERLRR